MLGNLFSPSGAGGGFLSNLGGLFSSLTSGLSGIFSGVGGLFSGLFGGGGGGGGIMSLISTGLSLFGGFFADGGAVDARRPIVVGERGPELFIPPVNGQIISNDVFQKAFDAANDNLPRDMSKDIVTLMLAGKFGGFRADGGSVIAGMSYAGGERGRELFIPKNGGSSSNDNNASGGGDNITVQMNITTQDAALHSITPPALSPSPRRRAIQSTSPLTLNSMCQCALTPITLTPALMISALGAGKASLLSN